MLSKTFAISAALIAAATATATATKVEYYSPYARSYAPRSYVSAPRYRNRHPLTKKLIEPKSPHLAFQLSYADFKALKDKVAALEGAGADNDALISRVDTLEATAADFENQAVVEAGWTGILS